MKPLSTILLAAAAAVLASCAAFKKTGKDTAENEKPAATPPRLVGRIASIPPDRRFVLIQSYEKWNVEAGTILTTRGEGERTANLRVTGENLGQFAAADLQSGEVEIGDPVYSRHRPKPAETIATTPAETAETTPGPPKIAPGEQPTELDTTPLEELQLPETQ